MVLEYLFGARPTMKAKPAGGTLTDNERAILSRLEEAVDDVLAAIPAMIEGGKALGEIRAKQLFRDQAKTWQAYCDLRFRMTLRRADQLIAFAGLAAAVEEISEETGTAVPVLSERALRPLTGLAEDDARDALREAAADGGLTPRSIAKAAVARKGMKTQTPRPVRLRLPGGTVIVEINRKGFATGVGVEALLTAAIEAVRRGRSEAA